MNNRAILAALVSTILMFVFSVWYWGEVNLSSTLASSARIFSLNSRLAFSHEQQNLQDESSKSHEDSGEQSRHSGKKRGTSGKDEGDPLWSPRVVVQDSPEILAARKDSNQLWIRWENMLANGDFQQIPIVGAMLAERLRVAPVPEVYEKIARLLEQEQLSAQSRLILIELLGEIATPEALELLLELSQNGTESPVYIPSVQTISRIGDNRWDGRFHEELSQLLENAWAASDGKNADELARPLAKIGAPSGTLGLLQPLTISNPRTGGESEADRLKGKSAMKVLSFIKNPASLPVLTEALRNAPPGTTIFDAIVKALANMGNPDAIKILLDYYQNAPEESAPSFERWLSKVNNPESIELIINAQHQMPFRNEAMETAYANVVENLRSSRDMTTTSSPLLADPAPNRGARTGSMTETTTPIFQGDPIPLRAPATSH